MSELTQAINYVNTNHPLPRCVHDQALRDHSGEALEPPCGCRAEKSYRTKWMDYDTRREPTTDRFCVRCQKDIKPDSPVRLVHLVDGQMLMLHPADEVIYEREGNKAGDMGARLIGIDCARAEGLEWSVPA